MVVISQAAKKRADELIQAKHEAHGPGMNAAWAALEELLQRVSDAAHSTCDGEGALAEFRLPREKLGQAWEEEAVLPFGQHAWQKAIDDAAAAFKRGFAPLRAALHQMAAADVERTLGLAASSPAEKVDQPAADEDLRPYGWAPGHYTIWCADCPPYCFGMGAKRSWRCKEHAEKAREAHCQSEQAKAGFASFKLDIGDIHHIEPFFWGEKQVYRPQPSPADEVLAMIEELRSDTAASVTILCDDEEAWHKSERLAVEVCSDWTDYRNRRFRGSSVHDCLARAIAARRAAKAQGEGAAA